MNTTIIFCDFCSNRYIETGSSLLYYLTSCGKVICNICLQSRQMNCTKCAKCSRLEISINMGRGVNFLFKDLSKVAKEVQNAANFQDLRYKLLYKNLRQEAAKYREKCQQVEHLEKQNAALEVMVNKLKESNYYLKEQSSQQQIGEPIMPFIFNEISSRIDRSHSTGSNNSNTFQHNGDGLIMPRHNTAILAPTKSIVAERSKTAASSRVQILPYTDFTNGVVHNNIKNNNYRPVNRPQTAFSVISHATHKGKNTNTNKYTANSKYFHP